MTMTLALMTIGVIALLLLIVSLIVGEIGDFFTIDAFDGAIGSITLFAFFAVFGFTGGILTGNTDWPLFASLAVAFVTGAVFGFFLERIVRFFQKSDSGEVSENDMVGMHGTVVLSIPEKGFGKVRVDNHGHVLEVSAISASGSIVRGTQIEVVSLMGPGSVSVAPVVTQ